ncbi:MAG: nitroreductase family protein, partial [Thermotogota bacterium]
MATANSDGQQPWRFIVVEEPQLRDELASLEIERDPYYRSPQLIVVCGDIGSMKWKMHWLTDCAAAIENLLLAAHALGLGAVWQELYPYHQRVAKVRRLLGIPDTIYPMAVVSIGHPAEKKPPVDRDDPEKVRWNPGSTVASYRCLFTSASRRRASSWAFAL